MLSSNIKNQKYDNFSEQPQIDDKNTIQTTESVKNKSLKNEEHWKNENALYDPSILHQYIEIKQEDVKVDPDSDAYCDDPNSIIELSPSGTVEFVEMQNVKIEKIDEYNEQEDPIKTNEGSYICDYCKTALTTAEYYQKHIRRCKGRVYNQSSTSETPIPKKKSRSTNDEEELYQCNNCNDKFKSHSGFSDHLRRHTGVGLYPCTKCHKQFTKPSRLANHMLIHSGARPHKCTQCGQSFTQLSNLTAHMRTHMDERPHQCSQCSMAFTESGSLVIHMRIHTGERPYQCTQCNKSFTQTGALASHMRTHTGEKPYLCKICSKAFIQSSVLKRHMKTHSNKTYTDERPYQCSQCNKAFKQTSSLESHMRNHTGEKPYQCTICSRAFAQSSFLKRHMHTHSYEITFKSN